MGRPFPPPGAHPPASRAPPGRTRGAGGGSVPVHWHWWVCELFHEAVRNLTQRLSDDKRGELGDVGQGSGGAEFVMAASWVALEERQQT